MRALNNIRSVEIDDGNSLLVAVFDNFSKDALQKLDDLRANSNDIATLGSGAHAIKSMALNIGAKSLSEYCDYCETEWKKGAIADASREIEVMHGHYVDAVHALEAYIETASQTEAS